MASSSSSVCIGSHGSEMASRTVLFRPFASIASVSSRRFLLMLMVPMSCWQLNFRLPPCFSGKGTMQNPRFYPGDKHLLSRAVRRCFTQEVPGQLQCLFRLLILCPSPNNQGKASVCHGAPASLLASTSSINLDGSRTFFAFGALMSKKGRWFPLVAQVRSSPGPSRGGPVGMRIMWDLVAVPFPGDYG